MPFKFFLFWFFNISLLSSATHAQIKKCIPYYLYQKDDIENQKNIDVSKLVQLTQWPIQENIPIYSILISHQGKLFYEMYTSQIKENEIHAMYSVTKSVVALLIGIAKDQGYIKNTTDSIVSMVPSNQIDTSKLKKFSNVSIKEAMGMSAISSEEYPLSKSIQAQKNSALFFMSMNRFKHSLDEPLVNQVGKDFNYSENTMSIIGGALQAATGKSLMSYAGSNLFDKMNFKDYRWLYRDFSGNDLAGFGLKLRPFDMHKLGVLVLNKGCWDGEQIISESWIEQIKQPWIKSNSEKPNNDYGWLWWHYNFNNNWEALVAHGKGEQLLIVFPKKQVVVSVTAHVSPQYPKGQVLTKLVNQFIIPLFDANGRAPKAEDISQLKRSLKETLNSQKNFRGLAEPENEPSQP